MLIVVRTLATRSCVLQVSGRSNQRITYCKTGSENLPLLSTQNNKVLMRAYGKLLDVIKTEVDRRKASVSIISSILFFGV
jgi:hypothetical protein